MGGCSSGSSIGQSHKPPGKQDDLPSLPLANTDLEHLLTLACQYLGPSQLIAPFWLRAMLADLDLPLVSPSPMRAEELNDCVFQVRLSAVASVPFQVPKQEAVIRRDTDFLDCSARSLLHSSSPDCADFMPDTGSIAQCFGLGIKEFSERILGGQGASFRQNRTSSGISVH
jgi:hypothetical protein